MFTFFHSVNFSFNFLITLICFIHYFKLDKTRIHTEEMMSNVTIYLFSILINEMSLELYMKILKTNLSCKGLLLFSLILRIRYGEIMAIGNKFINLVS